jgi:hypothetical protein
MARDPVDRYPAVAAMKAYVNQPTTITVTGLAARLKAPVPWTNWWRIVRIALLTIAIPVALFFLFLFMLTRHSR